MAGGKPCVSLGLLCPNLQWMILCWGLKHEDVAIHGGHEKVHAIVVVEVVCKDHRIGRFTNVFDICSTTVSVRKQQLIEVSNP